MVNTQTVEKGTKARLERHFLARRETRSSAVKCFAVCTSASSTWSWRHLT